MKMRLSISKAWWLAATSLIGGVLSNGPSPAQQATPSATGGTRTEKDLLGEKQIPADAYYGVQTWV
jgi:hypothetical protein